MDHKTRIVPIAVAALVGLLGVGVVAAQTPQATPGGQQRQGAPQPIPGDVAFVPLDGQGGSGVSGVAVLHAGPQELQQQMQMQGTAVLLGIKPPSGLPFLAASAEDLGEVVILEGACGEAGAVVAVLGNLTPIFGGDEAATADGTPSGTPSGGNATPTGTSSVSLQQQQDVGDATAFGIAMHVPVQMTTLLDGSHVLAILEKAQDGGGQQDTGTPTATPSAQDSTLTPGAQLSEDRNLLACGVMTEDNMLSAAGQAGGPSATPQATPQRTPSGTPGGTPSR